MPMESDSVARFGKLEDRVAMLEIKGAVEVERQMAIIQRLDKIDGHISKLLWLIIIAIVGAFMSFVIRGGLNV